MLRQAFQMDMKQCKMILTKEKANGVVYFQQVKENDFILLFWSLCKFKSSIIKTTHKNILKAKYIAIPFACYITSDYAKLGNNITA